MQYVNEINDAFKSEPFQTWVKSAISLVPELKHEGIVCSALAAALKKSGVSARREHRNAGPRGRRFDIYLGGDIALEAKYHLDFDIASIQKAMHNFPELKKKLHKFGKNGSWNSGEAVLFELMRLDKSRLDKSYFLWSVCCRGSRPPDDACMQKSSIAWLNKLASSEKEDPNAYVKEALMNFVDRVQEEFGVKSITLAPVEVDQSVLYSILFMPIVNVNGQKDCNGAALSSTN